MSLHLLIVLKFSQVFNLFHLVSYYRMQFVRNEHLLLWTPWNRHFVSRRVGTKQIGHFEQHSAGHHAPTGQDGKLKKNTFYTNKRRLESRTIVGFFSCPFQINLLIADLCQHLDLLYSPCNSDFPIIWLVVVSTGGITSHLFVGLHVAELLQSIVLLRLPALSRIRIASRRVHILLHGDLR